MGSRQRAEGSGQLAAQRPRVAACRRGPAEGRRLERGRSVGGDLPRRNGSQGWGGYDASMGDDASRPTPRMTADNDETAVRWLALVRESRPGKRSTFASFAERGWARLVLVGCPLAASIVEGLWCLQLVALLATHHLCGVPITPTASRGLLVELAGHLVFSVFATVALGFLHLVAFLAPIALVAGAAGATVVAGFTRTWSCQRPQRAWAGLALGVALGSSCAVFWCEDWDAQQDDSFLSPLILRAVVPVFVGNSVGVAVPSRPPMPRQARQRRHQTREPSRPQFTVWALLAIVTGSAVSVAALRHVWLSSPSLAIHFATLLVLSVTWLPLCVYAERAIAARGWFRRKRAPG